MGAVAFVEVLDRRGTVRARTPLENLPATIGRAYSNAVILDDRYVCPVHARLVPDDEGWLAVEDLNSVNGLHLPGRAKRLERVALQSGTVIRIGHTRLRLVDPVAPVPAAVEDPSADSGLEQLARSRPYAGGALGAVVALLAFSMYLDSFEGNRVAEIVGVLILAPFLLALWAGAWALASRVVVQRFEFIPHVAVASAVLFITVLYTEVGGYLSFLYPSNPLNAVWVAAGLAVSAMLLYGHLLFASTLTRRRRLAWSVGLSVALFALGGLVGLLVQEEYSAYTDDPGGLKPVTSALIPAQAAEDYVAALSKLKDEVDDLVAEEE